MIKRKRRELPPIPSGRRYVRGRIEFAKHPDGQWTIVGEASKMAPGTTVTVTKFIGENQDVVVDEWVAEYTTRHAGIPVKYVMALFSNPFVENKKG